MKLNIRKTKQGDLEELQQLFVGSIATVCKLDYNPEQIKVWTSSVADHERWSKIISNQIVLVAMGHNRIVGFVTLKNGNHIDLFYVHKDYQRQGIAYELHQQVEMHARENDHRDLTSDVSITARPFFERMGYKILKEQTVFRQGMEFVNFKMKKKLNNE
ncbi:GNAT family N-acetyltransferase [Allomuricauda sp. NBRC 101325]|uniref:GNAT family N-acetyltransferase n=1 Tax=Allomuricauda sp. NBRC 101325 TaxID=1113758 RepID=UPI0024A0261A|nr:GNAT family N-acetyltransferase [Muricauda sp. NBRC 101325]GLU45253.1 acetyltransferase [Muricauda sp. NBRC 101325]